MKLKLTFDETQKLDKDGCVYALRDGVTYLIEAFGSKYIVTTFSLNVDVVKSYQQEIKV